MAASWEWRQVAALLLLVAPTLGSGIVPGLGDEAALIQLQEHTASLSAHAEVAAEMVSSVFNVIRKAAAQSHEAGAWSSRDHARSKVHAAGCEWPTDYKANFDHMMEFMPEVQHAVLSTMLPKMIEKANRKAEEADEPERSPEEEKAAQRKMIAKMKKRMKPLKEELMPPECDQGAMKKKIMSQSLTGGTDAEDMLTECVLKVTHASPACARCSGNFLRDYMGRGMMGLASSCVPACSSAQNACKKGMTESCLSKGFPCLKCLKPGMLEFTNCLGLNATQLGLPNKVDLFAKALRDGSTSGEGLQQLIDDIVIATNA